MILQNSYLVILTIQGNALTFKIAIHTIFFLLLIKFSHGQQDYYFRHYQVENGLSHNTVMCSLQDEKGFMWLGTKDGLNRFDGNSFKVFRHEDSDSLSIGNDYIRCLTIDKFGNLFVGTQRGLYKYDPRTESFSVVHSSSNKTIKEISIDAQGNLWFIAEGTLVQLLNQKQIVRIYDKAAFFVATSMCTSSDGGFWVSTDNGFLKKYDPASGSFISVDVFNKKVPAYNWIEKIYASRNGTILIGTSSNGLWSYDISTKKSNAVFTQYKDRTGIYVRDILQTKNDEFWMATESGIFVYNSSNNSITNLKKNYHNPYSLSDNAVYTLCKDKEGGIWAGTYFGGINYFSQQEMLFQKYFPDYTKNNISGNAVREIVKDKYGNLWVGTEDAGLNKINPGGNISHFLPNGKKDGLSYYNIHGLLAVEDKLWIGTFEHGLDVMDIRSGKVFRHYAAGTKPGNLKSNFIFSIYRTKDKQLLLGTTTGVFCYQPKTDNFYPIPQLTGYTYNILEDAKGVWWTATISEGIKFFNPHTGQYGRYQYEAFDINSISNNMVNSLFEDRHGNLWIATEGGGICKLGADRKTIIRYSTKNGLPSNFIFKILEDNQHHLWISTSKGLVEFNPSNNSMIIYKSTNGLLNDQFNYNSGFKDSSGRMYFGSVKGMISFNPENFHQTSFVPPIYFTGFQVNNVELPIKNKSALPESIIYTHKIKLSYSQSSFSIDFAALSYTGIQINEYAYKMEGIDTFWTHLKQNRKAYFTNLSPGNYVFKVRTVNGTGNWNKDEAKLEIMITPPWWESNIAYGLYILFGFGLISIIVRAYHRYVKLQNKQKLDQLSLEKEKEIYDAKMKFFTNIAHEIKTPLTLIKAPLDRVIEKTINIPEIRSSLAIMQRNTDRLLDLTNQLLDYRKTEAGGFTLNFEEENVSNLLEETYLNFKSLAEQKNIHFILHLPLKPLIAFVDGEVFTKIISNLISNAIKYATKRIEINLMINRINETFIVEVINDGYLIPEDMKEKIFEPFVRLKKTEKQKGTGVGLALARSLTQLHGGKLYAKGDNETVNTFILELQIFQTRPSFNKISLPNSNISV